MKFERLKINGKIVPHGRHSNVVPTPLVKKQDRIQKLLLYLCKYSSLWKREDIELAKELSQKGLVKIFRSKINPRWGHNRYEITELGMKY